MHVCAPESSVGPGELIRSERSGAVHMYTPEVDMCYEIIIGRGDRGV